jgi:hypothetical protein
MSQTLLTRAQKKPKWVSATASRIPEQQDACTLNNKMCAIRRISEQQNVCNHDV